MVPFLFLFGDGCCSVVSSASVIFFSFTSLRILQGMALSPSWFPLPQNQCFPKTHTINLCAFRWLPLSCILVGPPTFGHFIGILLSRLAPVLSMVSPVFLYLQECDAFSNKFGQFLSLCLHQSSSLCRVQSAVNSIQCISNLGIFFMSISLIWVFKYFPYICLPSGK